MDKTLKKSSHNSSTHQLCPAIPRGNRQNAACIDKETHDHCVISHQAHQPKIGLLHELEAKVITAIDRSHPSNYYKSNVIKNILH